MNENFSLKFNKNVFVRWRRGRPFYRGHLKVLGEMKGTTAHMPLDSKINEFSFTKAFNFIETKEKLDKRLP